MNEMNEINEKNIHFKKTDTNSCKKKNDTKEKCIKITI
jgi:hypothetical protein